MYWQLEPEFVQAFSD